MDISCQKCAWKKASPMLLYIPRGWIERCIYICVCIFIGIYKNIMMEDFSFDVNISVSMAPAGGVEN